MLLAHKLTKTIVLFVAAVVVTATTIIAAPDAHAHAELRQASPRVDSVAGGAFHFVALQFTGLDERAPFEAAVLDPAGTSIGRPAVREEQRIVVPINPLTVPGTYTVTFTTVGEDGDLVDDRYSFRYDPAAPEPEPIDIDLSAPQVLGWFGYSLILVGAGILAFLVHRFWSAWQQYQSLRV